ncbi:MAG: DUF1801 domain-containing protein [Bacteroidota bacterium]
MKSRTGARKRYSSVKEYLASFSGRARSQMEELRKTIRGAAPDAKEIISYNMPAYRLKRVLVYFAGYKEHIGFYPTSSPIPVFKKELAKYKTSKGAIQIPIGDKIPRGLVKRIVRFRVREEKAREERRE